MIKMPVIDNFIRFREIIIYGIVGIVAFLIHLTCVFLLVNFAAMHPLFANIVAFLVSFNVSFWGHYHFTFTGNDAVIKHAMRRLFLLAMFNLGISEIFYFILLTIFHIQYLAALVINLAIISFFTYACAKFWVYKPA